MICTVAVSGLTVASASAAPGPATTNLGYTPISPPVRIADTRTGATDPSTYAGKTLGPGGTVTIDMPSGNVPASAGAIVAQLTAINPTSAGYLTAFPAGGSAPTAANVLFTTKQTVGNLVTVALGTDSAKSNAPAVTIINGAGSNAGNTDFTLDLYGYYATASPTSGAVYAPLAPARIYDSRSNSGQPGAGKTLGPGATATITVAGAGGVPATATAASLNVAVTDTTASSYIQCYPTGSAPSSSTPTVNQNWIAGETLSTQAVVGLTTGSITCLNAAGNTDVIVDVEGYYSAPGGTGALFTPLSSPKRLLDTRSSGGPVSAGSSATVTVGGANGIPSSATAGALNVTDIASGPNYLTAYPAGGSAPTAATVNYVSGDPSSTLSNGAYATTGSGGKVDVLTAASAANIVVDAFGYFSSSTGNTVSVSANPSTVPPDGTTTSTVTVTVKNSSGTAVPADMITFTTSGSPSGACGTVGSPSNGGATDTNGQVTATYTASSTAGTCTVTATEQSTSPGTGASGSTTITQGSSSGANTVTVSANPSTIPPDGATTSTVTATVKNSSGTAVSGDTITFTTSGAPSGACGTVGSPSNGGATDTNGQVTATYTASSTAGTCTVTATEQATSPGTGASGNTTITQSTSVNTVTVTSSSTSIVYPASSTATITATVKDSSGTAVSGDMITFTTSGTCGNLSPTSGSTTSSGTVTSTYTVTASEIGSSCTIKATEQSTSPGTGQSGKVSVMTT